MLRYFNGFKKIVFFPKSWANSVTSWIFSIGSSSGTISISNNTTEPSRGHGASFDVDTHRLAEVAAADFSRNFVARFDNSGIDGESIALNGAGQLRVDAEWLENFIRQRVKPEALNS